MTVAALAALGKAAACLHASPERMLRLCSWMPPPAQHIATTIHAPTSQPAHRRRSRTRSPRGGDRSRFLATDPAQAIAAQMQQAQQMAAQQEQLQRQLLAQQMLGVGGMLSALDAAGPAGQQGPTALDTLHRKQREIYIGNLAIGLTTKELLYEFWNQVGSGCFGRLKALRWIGGLVGFGAVRMAAKCVRCGRGHERGGVIWAAL